MNPFDAEAARYDAWFDSPRGRVLLANELAALKRLWGAGFGFLAFASTLVESTPEVPRPELPGPGLVDHAGFVGILGTKNAENLAGRKQGGDQRGRSRVIAPTAIASAGNRRRPNRAGGVRTTQK